MWSIDNYSQIFIKVHVGNDEREREAYQGCVGTALGIWLVRTGNDNASRLYPKKLPKNTNGTETQNHKNNLKKKKRGGKGERGEEKEERG